MSNPSFMMSCVQKPLLPIKERMVCI